MKINYNEMKLSQIFSNIVQEVKKNLNGSFIRNEFHMDLRDEEKMMERVAFEHRPSVLHTSALPNELSD